MLEQQEPRHPPLRVFDFWARVLWSAIRRALDLKEDRVLGALGFLLAIGLLYQLDEPAFMAQLPGWGIALMAAGAAVLLRLVWSILAIPAATVSRLRGREAGLRDEKVRLLIRIDDKDRRQEAHVVATAARRYAMRVHNNFSNATTKTVTATELTSFRNSLGAFCLNTHRKLGEQLPHWAEMFGDAEPIELHPEVPELRTMRDLLGERMEVLDNLLERDP